jgi:hypothetical protein
VTDELAPLLGALGRPRPLPEDLRRRIERAMVAEAMEAGTGALSALDAPRPLPEDMRQRLEWVLAMRASVGPHAAMARAERRRTSQRNQVRGARRDAAVAAVACFVLTATSMVLSEQPGRVGGPDPMQYAADFQDAAVGGGPTGADTAEYPDGAWAAGTLEGKLAAPVGSTGGSSAGGAYYYLPHPPPPYHAASAPPNLLAIPPLGQSGPPAQALPPPLGAPLRVGVIPGDAVQEAGFKAYIDLLNREGGAGGHHLHLVPAPSPGTIATVNLSTAPVADATGAPAGMPTPLVEGLLPFEGALKGDVFSPAGVPERQANLAVAAAGVPEGGTAAVYSGGAEPFASRVPAALDAALRARGVKVVHTAWDGNDAPPSGDADAAFLSLPTDLARTWLEAARVSGYGPPQGIWGIWSVADQSLVPAMSDGTQVVAPYGFPPAKELAELEARAGQSASARLVHGWLTAKWLAVAVWQGGTDNARLAERLRSSSIDSGGFFARYEVRPGSNVRTPEAVVLKPEGDRLTSEGSFGRAF